MTITRDMVMSPVSRTILVFTLGFIMVDAIQKPFLRMAK